MLVHDSIGRFGDRIGSSRLASRLRSIGLFDRCERSPIRPTLSTGLHTHRQARYPKQIVGPGHEISPGLRSIHSPVAGPAHSAHRLHPPKDFLDSLADSLAGLVSALPRRAPV